MTICIGPCKCGGYGQILNEPADTCHRDVHQGGIFGHFVTAKLKGKEDCRQGVVVSLKPLLIKGQYGRVYECEGSPTAVINPPPGWRIL